MSLAKYNKHISIENYNKHTYINKECNRIDHEVLNKPSLFFKMTIQKGEKSSKHDFAEIWNM